MEKISKDNRGAAPADHFAGYLFAFSAVRSVVDDGLNGSPEECNA